MRDVRGYEECKSWAHVVQDMGTKGARHKCEECKRYEECNIWNEGDKTWR